MTLFNYSSYLIIVLSYCPRWLLNTLSKIYLNKDSESASANVNTVLLVKKETESKK